MSAAGVGRRTVVQAGGRSPGVRGATLVRASCLCALLFGCFFGLGRLAQTRDGEARPGAAGIQIESASAVIPAHLGIAPSIAVILDSSGAHPQRKRRSASAAGTLASAATTRVETTTAAASTSAPQPAPIAAPPSASPSAPAPAPSAGGGGSTSTRSGGSGGAVGHAAPHSGATSFETSG